jgi:hypothetical protein
MRRALNLPKPGLNSSGGHFSPAEDFAVSGAAVLAGFVGSALIVRPDANGIDAPPPAAPLDVSSIVPVEQTKSIDAATAGSPANEEASSANPAPGHVFDFAPHGTVSLAGDDGGNTWTYLFASDGSFRFDTYRDAVTDPSGGAGNANSAAESFAPQSHVSANDAAVIVEMVFEANGSSSHYNTGSPAVTDPVVSDLGGAHSGNAAAIYAGGATISTEAINATTSAVNLAS